MHYFYSLFRMLYGKCYAGEGLANALGSILSSQSCKLCRDWIVADVLISPSHISDTRYSQG